MLHLGGPQHYEKGAGSEVRRLELPRSMCDWISITTYPPVSLPVKIRASPEGWTAMWSCLCVCELFVCFIWVLVLL